MQVMLLNNIFITLASTTIFSHYSSLESFCNNGLLRHNVSLHFDLP